MLFGWLPNPATVERVLSTLPEPYFCDAAPHLKDTGIGKDVLLWMGEQKVLAKLLPAHNQTRGTCTSHGWSRAVQDVMLNQIAMGAMEEWQGEVASEPIYAGGRVEIDRQPASNWQDDRQDGSTGIACAKWVQQYGILIRKVYGSIDLTKPNDNIACQWTASRSGVPDELEPLAKQHPIKQVAMVQSYEEARDAIANGYGVPVCSNQGFATGNSPNPRDSNGFCKPGGTWYHCMYFRASVTAKGNRPALICQQSWGNIPSGPSQMTLESGEVIELPMGCFGVDADVADRMLQQRDSYAPSHFLGFPSQALNFSPW